VSVALKKVDGVESANVSLNEGKVVIQLKAANSVRLEQIRRAVTDQGFTPKQARVTARGDLTVSKDGMQFNVTGSNDTFPVAQAPHGARRDQAAQNVVVTGIIAAPRNDNDRGVLQVLEVSKETSAPKQK
jgi:copper chaperone CopZ